ncbi:ATP-binding protein [Dactylosporangium sp. NBC_01737]|uniref:sensor histidine kinase n=1 Tax=Dactylosporangium sp. NBC_01737 TaxID=2975959 RepID=UPI002E158BF2|nr:ATP-binding protein [Dactylosporangium sp. NBC_01737]
MIILGLALVLAVSAAAVGVAVATGRSVRRGLRALLAGALRAAHPLPPSGWRDEVGRNEAGRDGIGRDGIGRDEIGRVAEAFDAVQRETARAAAEQAALRSGLTGMYADLARRSARLADALLERLDDAERDEADPDRLAVLFAFDHLATRIRHDTQSLLVLAGADTARDHAAPVPLLDVLRAAQSQIQAYQRVEYGRVDDDVSVEPAAVDGVVHLLAELLDNAARHAGADRPVVVDARSTGDGAVIHVADRGPAVDLARLEELNGRLADPPPFGPRLGLTVVARLAARHGLDVTLQPAPGSDGLVATVRLPSSLLCHAAPVPVETAPVGPEPKAPTPVVTAAAVSMAPVAPTPAAVPVAPTPATAPGCRWRPRRWRGPTGRCRPGCSNAARRCPAASRWTSRTRARTPVVSPSCGAGSPPTGPRSRPGRSTTGCHGVPSDRHRTWIQPPSNPTTSAPCCRRTSTRSAASAPCPCR